MATTEWIVEKPTQWIVESPQKKKTDLSKIGQAAVDVALAPKTGLVQGAANLGTPMGSIPIPSLSTQDIKNLFKGKFTYTVSDVSPSPMDVGLGAFYGAQALGGVPKAVEFNKALRGYLGKEYGQAQAEFKASAIPTTATVEPTPAELAKRPAIQEVPFSRLADSQLVTSTSEGTKIEPNLGGQFTADQNVRAKVQANDIFNYMGVQNAITGKTVNYGDLNPTFRSILSNKVLEMQQTGASPGMIQEAIQSYVNEERSNLQSPLIVISGIGKGSELEKGALDASLEVNVIPFMSKISLRELATDFAARGIDPSNARFVFHALTKATHGVPDLVRKTVQGLYNAAVRRGENVLTPPQAPEAPQTADDVVKQIIQEQGLVPTESPKHTIEGQEETPTEEIVPPEAPVASTEPIPEESIAEEVRREETRMNQQNEVARSKELLYGPEDYSPEAEVTQPDVTVIKQYYDTLKERNEQLFHLKKDKTSHKWAEDFYRKELEKIYDTMTPGQRAIVDEGDKKKVLEEYYNDMIENLKGQEAPCIYTGFTAKEHFDLTDVNGELHSLLGFYVVYSKVGDQWKFGLWQEATGYKIQDGDKFEISREVFEDAVRDNLAENSNALKFDDLNISAGGLSDSARAIHNSLAPANAQDVKKVKEAVRLGQEVNIPLITALQKTAPGRALLKITQWEFGKGAVGKALQVKPNLKLSDELFDYFKNEKAYSEYYRGLAKRLVAPYKYEVEKLNEKNFPGLKRAQYQEKAQMDEALMSSANTEIYCKEGDANNYAVTNIGQGGPNLQGQFTATSEADGLVKCFQKHNEFYKFDEPWLRQKFNIPLDVSVEQYLTAFRPKLFFYTLLTHPNVCPDTALQDNVRRRKAHLETAELNKLLNKGILDKGDMANKRQEGFTNRVWTYTDTQQKGSLVASRRTSGPLSSANIEAARYRTYEEYLFATGSWELPPDISNKQGLEKAIQQQKLSGRGLVPINNHATQLQEYIQDSELTVQQYETIKWLKAYEIPGTNLHWVEYEHTVDKQAKKEGFQSVQQFLTAKGYEQVKAAEGLVQWFQGGHDDPWLQRPLSNYLKGLYDARGMLRMAKVNEFLTFVRRIETINPFQHINLYLASMYTNPQFIVKAPGMFAKSLWKAPGIAVKMATGNYTEPEPVEQADLDKWLQAGLVPAGRMSGFMKSVFGKLEMGRYGLQQSMWQHHVELAASGLGIQTALWEHYMGPMNVSIARLYRDSFLRKGYSEEKAYRYATDLVNTINMTLPSWQYYTLGPLWRNILYASNLFIGPLNVYASAAYGLTKVPGLGILKNLYKYRDTPVSEVLNPIFATNSKEELNATWKAYCWHAIREIMARYLIACAIQYAYGKMRRGLKDGDPKLNPWNNPRGYQMSANLGEVDGHEHYFDPNALRTAILGYDLTVGKGVPTVLQNKANVQINWLFAIHDYFNKYGQLPTIVRNNKGDVIGGTLIDFINGVGSTVTPLGFGPGSELADKFGGVIRKGPALVAGDEELTQEQRQAENLRRYFMDKAHQEFRGTPEAQQVDKAISIAEKYGLTVQEARKLLTPPKVDKKALQRYGK